MFSVASRRAIQVSQERFYVNSFIEWLNRTRRSRFEVISEPNPPEAIIKSNKTIRWIEVGSAFWNVDYARDLNTYAALGERHCPMVEGACTGMDSEFASRFVSIVKKKLEKTSYVPVLKEYGQGYLIVPIYYPFLDRNTVSSMKDLWSQAVVSNLNCFRGIYIAYPLLGQIKFSRWPMR